MRTAQFAHKDKPTRKSRTMKISKRGLDFIKGFEGFRNHPYLCSAGVATIGYGSTYYSNGQKVSMSDKPITQAEAIELLCDTVEKYEDGVNDNVKKPLTQNQFDALVSFTYNLGVGALRSSTLLKKVNKNPNDESIADEFKKWVMAGGIELKGLKKRRNQEAWIYFEHLRIK